MEQTELSLTDTGREEAGRQLLNEINQIGEQAVYECGIRFKRIRDEHTHPKDMKWIDFCLRGCTWKKSQIYNSIKYAENVQMINISTTVEKLPSEGQLRPLSKLKSIEDKREVWEEVSNNGGKPTAEKVEKAVERKLMTSGHKKTKKGKPTKISFNPTTEKVDWARWTWNPVVGCKHGCTYCYARDFARRQKWDFEKPELFMHRLAAPKNSGIPKGMENVSGIRNVFTVSMGDLFGEWVPDNWIQKVMNAVNDNPQWNYIFLTKNPKRLKSFEWPDHAWAGTTVDCQDRVTQAEEAFRDLKAKTRFVSVEPFNEPIRFNHLEYFNWLIIGGRSRTTRMPEFQPEWKWVIALLQQAIEAGCQVYKKPNLPLEIKEFPGEKE